jgi:hypothetical protein
MYFISLRKSEGCHVVTLYAIFFASGMNKFKKSRGSTSANSIALKKQTEKDGWVTETEEKEAKVKSTRCYRSIMVTCHLERKSAECEVVFLDTGQDRQVICTTGRTVFYKEKCIARLNGNQIVTVVY